MDYTKKFKGAYGNEKKSKKGSHYLADNNLGVYL